MTVNNCANAFEAAYQYLEFSQFPITKEVNSLKCTTDAGSIINDEISPLAAEIGIDTWRQALKKFYFAYTTFGYHRRSNSLPPNLS